MTLLVSFQTICLCFKYQWTALGLRGLRGLFAVAAAVKVSKNVRERALLLPLTMAALRAKELLSKNLTALPWIVMVRKSFLHL